MLFGVYIMSIGLSDAIELYFNPLVHSIHNAPDIMRKRFKDYNYFDAFMSGIYCSVPIVVEYLICYTFNIHPFFIEYVSLINILTPIICYLTELQVQDLFISHKILYIVGFTYFVSIVSFKMLNHLITRTLFVSWVNRNSFTHYLF